MTAPASPPWWLTAAHSYRGRPPTQPVIPFLSVVERLHAHAAARPDAPLLTEAGPSGAGETVTYAGMAARVSARAAWLRERLGGERRVGLVMTNEPVAVETVLACMAIGCTATVLGPADPPRRQRAQCEAAGARAVLHPPGVACDLTADALRLDQLEPAGTPGGRRPGDPRPPDPHAPALVFCTSGTTAASKAVAQTCYAIAVNCHALALHHGLGPGDRLLCCLPLAHVNGLEFTIFTTIVAGAHVWLLPRFDPLGYVRATRLATPRIASVVPSILDALVDAPARLRLGEIGYFVSAAAPLHRATARGVRKRFGVGIVQGYGLTETTNFSTTMPVGPGHAAWLDHDPPPVGVALFGNEVAVLDGEGRPAPHGVEGEVCMRGHNVMACYLGNPPATADALRGGWFHSGDLGYSQVDPATGQALFVLTGRSKNVTKIAGESLSLDEVDRLLRDHPAVADAASYPCAQPRGDEHVEVAVVAGGVSDDDLRAHLAAWLPAHLLPRRFVRVDALPRLPTGKISRARLREAYGADRA